MIRNKQIAQDPWQSINAEEALPEGDVIVPFARFSAERDALLSRDYKVGVLLKGDDKLEELAPDLDRIDTIVLDFPVRDGRCYTFARLLRERYGYKKDIRAIGHVRKDKIFYMQRVGINVFELAEGEDPKEALMAFEDFSVRYQPSADETEPLYRRAQLK